MATPAKPEKNSITIEELSALNDEIIALVKAGVPLHHGLDLLGADLPGRLGKFTSRVAEELKLGRSLTEALENSGDGVPAVYLAVVNAGLRSGHLASALQGLSTTARQVAEIRRVTGAALIYPVVVVLLAWTFFCMLATKLPWLTNIGENLALWGFLVPVVFVSGLILWWILSARATSLNKQSSQFLFGWVPALGGLSYYGRAATFAEVLALLIEHEVPLGESLRLATDASGSPQLRQAGNQLAESFEKGAEPATIDQQIGELPSLVGWLIQMQTNATSLAQGIRHVAASYRRRAEISADWARFYLPVFLTLGLGGLATATYAAVVLVPWFQSLHELAMP